MNKEIKNGKIQNDKKGLNTWCSDNSVSFKSLSISDTFENVYILRSAHCPVLT